MPPHDGQVAVYTGSFDPITLGHLDVIERASRIFNHIVVGVGINPDKQPLFDQEERVKLVEAAVDHLDNVTVRRFHGLSVTFVREQKAHVVLRGVRSLTDIEAEFTMTLANRMLDPGIETVFLMADAQYSHISSSLLKQITPLANDIALGKLFLLQWLKHYGQNLQTPSPHCFLNCRGTVQLMLLILEQKRF